MTDISKLTASVEAVRCRGCSLCDSRTQVVLPDGPSRGVLAIGEAPGQQEDENGVGFFGIAGRNLDQAMSQFGIARDQYARANVVRCRPPGNRAPKRNEIAACSGWLLESIARANPAVILAVGQSSAKRLIGFKGGSYLKYVEERIERASAGIGELDHFNAPELERAIPVVPMPHTSPLAWNRPQANGRPIRELGYAAIALAVDMANRTIHE